MNILHRGTLPPGGFAGLKERRLVIDPKIKGGFKEDHAWPGLGDFVYLADARFVPKGETRMHNHKEVDVISVVLEGRIAHEGSLEHGQELVAGDVQVQRAGGEGFSHNEVNPDVHENRMLQLWALPEKPGEPAGYRVYSPEPGALARIYGGRPGQDETFASHTTIDVGRIRTGDRVARDGEFLAYVATGRGTANGEPVSEGDLIRGDGIVFVAAEEADLIIVQTLTDG